jgi:hypothetical protein
VLVASIQYFEQVYWIANILGISNMSLTEDKERADGSLIAKLAVAAERTATNRPASITHGLWLERAGDFSDIGKRLEMLDVIYEASGMEVKIDLGERLFVPLVADLRRIPHVELLTVLEVLRRKRFRAWGSWFTLLSKEAIDLYDDPDDIKSWSLLRDLLDVIDVVPGYREELVEKFELFAQGLIQSARDILDNNDDYDEDIDAELSAWDFDDLVELAERWGVVSDEISGIAEVLHARQDEQYSGQPRESLSDKFQVKPLDPPSLFDHL